MINYYSFYNRTEGEGDVLVTFTNTNHKNLLALN